MQLAIASSIPVATNTSTQIQLSNSSSGAAVAIFKSKEAELSCHSPSHSVAEFSSHTHSECEQLVKGSATHAAEFFGLISSASVHVDASINDYKQVKKWIDALIAFEESIEEFENEEKLVSDLRQEAIRLTKEEKRLWSQRASKGWPESIT